MTRRLSGVYRHQLMHTQRWMLMSYHQREAVTVELQRPARRQVVTNECVQLIKKRLIERPPIRVRVRVRVRVRLKEGILQLGLGLLKEKQKNDLKSK